MTDDFEKQEEVAKQEEFANLADLEKQTAENTKNLERVIGDVTRYRREQGPASILLNDFRTAVLRSVAGSAIVMLLLGLITPFWAATLDDDDDYESFSVVGSMFAAFTAEDDDDKSDYLDVFFGVAFLVLIAVVIVVAAQLFRIAGRGDFLPDSFFKSTFAVLLGLGVLGAWATSALADDWSWQPSLPLLTLGAVVAIPILVCGTTG